MLKKYRKYFQASSLQKCKKCYIFPISWFLIIFLIQPRSKQLDIGMYFWRILEYVLFEKFQKILQKSFIFFISFGVSSVTSLIVGDF